MRWVTLYFYLRKITVLCRFLIIFELVQVHIFTSSVSLSLPFIGYKSEVTSIVSCTLCPILLLRLRMQLCSLPCSREVGLDGMEVQS